VPRRAKPAAAALVALLLAVAIAACGGGSESTRAATAATTAEQTQAGSGGRHSVPAHPESGGVSGHPVPRHHHDSGGGSAQFRVKGGDNSIQEFGSEASGSELAAAAAALHGFLDARAAGEWAAACSHMSKSVIASLSRLAASGKQPNGADCAEILKKLINPAVKRELEEEAEQADVGSLRIEGGRAFIIYRSTEGTVMAMPMVDEGGTWEVGSLAGVPLS